MKKFSKVLIILIVGIVMLIGTLKVYAANDLTDLWEDQGSLNDINGNQTTTPETTTPETTKPETTKPETTTPTTNTTNKTDIPKAGIAEDTIMIVTVASLIVVAVYTFKKVNYYKNI